MPSNKLHDHDGPHGKTYRYRGRLGKVYRLTTHMDLPLHAMMVPCQQLPNGSRRPDVQPPNGLGPDMAKRKQSDTTVPPVKATVEDIMKALLATPPPPAGHPSTRKQKVAKKSPKRR